MLLSSTPSPDEYNTLIELILHVFVEKFVPRSKLLYLYNVDEKITRLDKEGLQELGITLESYKDVPDVILYDKARNWLMLIDVATNHGPITPLRRTELKKMFDQFHIGLVFVTAFLDYKGFQEELETISWETEVWVAEAPSHMIHFDGEKLLGPY